MYVLTEALRKPPGSAIAGQNNTFIPHKGVLSPAEKTLYVSYSNGAGPYDGTDGKLVLSHPRFKSK